MNDAVNLPVSPWSKYPLPKDAPVAPVTPWEQQIRDAAIYPESDGKPIAESTDQFDWIETIKGNVETLLADNPLAFVAADLLWYPDQTNPRLSVAPDTMIVFGRPKGARMSYQQWNEDNIAPQVVFEVRSRTNTEEEMTGKRGFYERNGILEYYDYDSVSHRRFGWHRSDAFTPFEQISEIEGWISPLLGIRFGSDEADDLRLFYPDGRVFQSFVATSRRAETAERMLFITEEQRDAATAERDAATVERDAATAERDAAQAERDAVALRATRLAERLRALGIDPDAL